MKRLLTSLLLTAGLVFSIGISVSGCSPKSPEERIASIRARYKATLNGFIIQEEPIEVEVEPILEPEGLDEMPIDDSAEALDLDEIPTYAVSKKVLLDILLHNDSAEKLDGLTVDISMVDAEHHEKGHWQVWFDTSTIEKANIASRIHILDDPGYEEGDGFAAEVRQVPVSERSEYREFSTAK